MAEQRSIVLGGLLAAIVLAGGLFYFFFQDEAPGALLTQVARQTPGPEETTVADMRQEMTDMNASPTPDAVMTTKTITEQVTERAVPSPSPAVSGAQNVAPTAQTGSTEIVVLAALTAAVLGFVGVVQIAWRSL